MKTEVYVVDLGAVGTVAGATGIVVTNNGVKSAEAVVCWKKTRFLRFETPPLQAQHALRAEMIPMASQRFPYTLHLCSACSANQAQFNVTFNDVAKVAESSTVVPDAAVVVVVTDIRVEAVAEVSLGLLLLPSMAGRISQTAPENPFLHPHSPVSVLHVPAPCWPASHGSIDCFPGVSCCAIRADEQPNP
jgi:hypothetical protein